MNNERIDHAAEAIGAMDRLRRGDVSSEAEHRALQAICQAAATLYLAEQQRIANLIALAAIEFDMGDGGKAHIVQGVVDIQQTDGGLLDVKIDPEIAAALGIGGAE